MTMLHIPLPERPRERCLANGPQCLSLRELLCILFGSGPAARGGCVGLADLVVGTVTHEQAESETERTLFLRLEDSVSASTLSGLGQAQKARLLACFEIARRYHASKAEPALRTRSVSSRLSLRERCAVQVPARARAEATEWLGFVPVYQGSRAEIGGLCVVERGCRTHVNTDSITLFSRILALRPAGIVLFHNHPSGDLTPSEQDLDLTHCVRDRCMSFGITLIDHGVVSGAQTHWVGSVL